MSILKRFKKVLLPKQEPASTLTTTKLERLNRLTAREYEAFLILIEGYTLKFCAEKMGVKYSTANTYQNAIYKKLSVKNRAKLIIDYKDLVRSDTHDMQKM